MATGLLFYRKNQSLQDLLNERPQSMESLRATLLGAVDEIETRVQVLEREFNGGRKHEDEVRKIAKASRGIMKVLELTYLNSSEQIKEIVERTLEPTEVFQFDMEAVAIVKDYHRKLVEFVPGKVEPVVEQLHQVLKLLQMYCLSFSPIKKMEKDTNPGLETCVHYELKRTEFEKAVKGHLDNIQQMANMYQTEEGVQPKCFGLVANELARGCDCGDITYALLFPQACANMKNAGEGLKKWIREDSAYVEFLKNDLVTLDNANAEADHDLRDAKHQQALAHHAKRTCQKEIDELQIEMNKIARREQKLLKLIDRIETETRVLHYELAMKEAELKKFKLDSLAITDMTEEEYEKGVNSIAGVIATIRLQIPENKHKIDEIKLQQKEVFARREVLTSKRKELEEREKDIIKAKGVVFEATEKKKQASEAFAIIKDVYLKKTGPGTTKKIFNAMPVHPRHEKSEEVENKRNINRKFQLPPIKPHKSLKPLKNDLQYMKVSKPAIKEDPLNRATRIAAKKLGQDWPTFYRTLPFHPNRGEVEKDNDIINVSQSLPRATHTSHAYTSIEKWRRLDGLASIKTLKKSLAEIKREDIVTEIEKKAEKPEIDPHKRAKANWGKVRKFKAALGKILELKAKARETRRERIREQLIQEKEQLKREQRIVIDVTDIL